MENAGLSEKKIKAFRTTKKLAMLELKGLFVVLLQNIRLKEKKIVEPYGRDGNLY